MDINDIVEQLMAEYDDPVAAIQKAIQEKKNKAGKKVIRDQIVDRTMDVIDLVAEYLNEPTLKDGVNREMVEQAIDELLDTIRMGLMLVDALPHTKAGLAKPKATPTPTKKKSVGDPLVDFLMANGLA